MIVFAGEAFTQLPITSDYISAKMFLETINPSLISTQGTDIAGAINLAMKSFTPNEGVGRAIVLITDGENHEGGAVEAAQEAAKKGVRVFVLGVGSPDGAPIPAEGTNEFRRDKDGNVIVTRLNEHTGQGRNGPLHPVVHGVLLPLLHKGAAGGIHPADLIAVNARIQLRVVRNEMQYTHAALAFSIVKIAAQLPWLEVGQGLLAAQLHAGAGHSVIAPVHLHIPGTGFVGTAHAQPRQRRALQAGS